MRLSTRGLDRVFRGRGSAQVKSLTQKIRDLFKGGQQGAWYDPSDLTTLYQDSAGTVPVTAVEQPVGLMLDKRLGLVLGPELVTNGDFSNGTTGWEATAATASVVAGQAVIVSNAGAAYGYFRSAAFTTVAGRWYEVKADFVDAGNTVATIVQFADSGLTTFVSINVGVETGPKKFYAYATTSSSVVRIAVGGSAGVARTATFDNISVRELPGNHAYHTPGSTLARPTLSARYNLLTKTEDFADAVWLKTAVTLAANTSETLDPLGGNTADFIQESTVNSAHQAAQQISAANGAYTASVYIKAAGRTQALVSISDASSGDASWGFNLSTGELIAYAIGAGSWTNISAAIVSAGNGWYKCSVTATKNAGSAIITKAMCFNGSNFSYAGDITKGLYIWGADLRAANEPATLPPYQRVNTATDYDTVGFPVYLRTDGVDDGMQTNSIDFSASDKMFVAAGVRKLSDANYPCVIELSPSIETNNGAFALFSGDGVIAGKPAWNWASRGSAKANVASADIYPSPISNVLSGLGDISGDSAILRINGAQAASSTADQGTGNFGNYPFYLFARGGSSLRANLRFYGSIIRGGTLPSAAEINNAERYLSGKMGGGFV